MYTILTVSQNATFHAAFALPESALPYPLYRTEAHNQNDAPAGHPDLIFIDQDHPDAAILQQFFMAHFPHALIQKSLLPERLQPTDRTARFPDDCFIVTGPQALGKRLSLLKRHASLKRAIHLRQQVAQRSKLDLCREPEQEKPQSFHLMIAGKGARLNGLATAFCETTTINRALTHDMVFDYLDREIFHGLIMDLGSREANEDALRQIRQHSAHAAMPVVILEDAHVGDHADPPAHYEQADDILPVDLSATDCASIMTGHMTLYAFGERIRHFFTHEDFSGFVDPLSGLQNRTFFTRYLTRVLDPETGDALPRIIAIRLTDLENINALYGFEAGDRMVAHAGTLLKRLTRAEDIACRFIGPLFLVALFDSTAESAELVHTRIKALMKHTNLVLKDGHASLPLTLQSRVIEAYPGEDVAALLRRIMDPDQTPVPYQYGKDPALTPS